jgi:hypothetical protein
MREGGSGPCMAGLLMSCRGTGSWVTVKGWSRLWLNLSSVYSSPLLLFLQHGEFILILYYLYIDLTKPVQKPLRSPPKVYQLLLKTHKLIVFLSVTPSTTVASLKQEALSALTSNVSEQVDDVPKVTSVDQFELCQAVQERGSTRSTPKYVLLRSEQTVQGTLGNWESLFIQFRDDNGELHNQNMFYLQRLRVLEFEIIERVNTDSSPSFPLYDRHSTTSGIHPTR